MAPSNYQARIDQELAELARKAAAISKREDVLNAKAAEATRLTDAERLLQSAEEDADRRQKILQGKAVVHNKEKARLAEEEAKLKKEQDEVNETVDKNDIERREINQKWKFLESDTAPAIENGEAADEDDLYGVTPELRSSPQFDISEDESAPEEHAIIGAGVPPQAPEPGGQAASDENTQRSPEDIELEKITATASNIIKYKGGLAAIACIHPNCDGLNAPTNSLGGFFEGAKGFRSHCYTNHLADMKKRWGEKLPPLDKLVDSEWCSKRMLTEEERQLMIGGERPLWLKRRQKRCARKALDDPTRRKRRSTRDPDPDAADGAYAETL